MKKTTRISIYILLCVSMFIPTLPAILVKAQAGPITFRTSSSALIVSGDWDVPNSDGYNILIGYYAQACEFICSGYATYFAGTKDKVKEDEWWPILATSWETEYRPTNETNYNPLGAFNNTGGRKSIEFTLREGVKFHDGSDWNATVAKWNIDRIYLITGNLTGNANGITDQRNANSYWSEIVQTKDYWTASWNLSEYDAPDTSLNPFTPPDPSRYSYYYLTDPDGPSPVIANNSHPYGGWDPIASNFIHYAPYDQFPLVRWVEITEDKQSGGKIKVHFNGWQSYGMAGMWVRQISYQAYHKDFTETAIYGYENGNDMIGTGPYIYVEHDEIADRGYMVKNMNYWNRTALEADGWFDVERYEIVQFPQGQIGIDARNVALQTHAIDYAYDNVWLPIDYDYVIASPNINYREDYPLEYVTQLTLNSINETYWAGGLINNAWPDIYNFTWMWTAIMPVYYSQELGKPGGIPQALRKALNYAFDYDTMINVNLDGRAVRASFTGVGSVFYNASVPQATYDLEYAREVLYNQNGSDPRSLTQRWWPINFTALMDARGLTNFTDAPANNLFWQNVAENNPIFKMEVFWDDTHQDLKDLYEVAANNLGVKFVDEHGGSNKAPTGTILWDHCVGTYWTETFDGYSSIWSSHSWMMDYNYPMTIGEGWYDANYADPDHGQWRTGTPSVYWPTWNFGFSYDTQIDYLIGVMYYSDPQRKIETISKIADKEMNELYPMVWCYQTTGGEALWANWDTFYVPDRRGEPAPFWGVYSPHFLSYTPGEEFPLIPGAPLLLTLAGTAASMIGIIWTIMRKKRR